MGEQESAVSDSSTVASGECCSDRYWAPSTGFRPSWQSKGKQVFSCTQHECSWVHRACGNGEMHLLRLALGLSLWWRTGCFNALLEPCPSLHCILISIFFFFQSTSWLCPLLLFGGGGEGTFTGNFLQSNHQRISGWHSLITQRICFVALVYTGSRDKVPF